MRRSLSQSAIGIYRSCPYAYKLHYVDRKQSVFWDPSILDVGSIAHDVLDIYYKNYYLMSGTPNDILVKTYNVLKEKWDMSYSVEQFKKIYECLQNHATWESGNITNKIGVKPLTEIKIESDGFFGIIDYVDLVNRRVIDWKTGKWPTLSYTYRMQAHVYKKLFEGKFGEELTHFYFYFLHSGEFRTVKYDMPKQKEVGEAVETLKNSINDSLMSNDFPKKPRTKNGCKYCSYKLYCKFGDKNVQEEN